MPNTTSRRDALAMLLYTYRTADIRGAAPWRDLSSEAQGTFLAAADAFFESPDMSTPGAVSGFGALSLLVAGRRGGRTAAMIDQIVAEAERRGVPIHVKAADAPAPAPVSAEQALVRLSEWIDKGNVGRDPESVTWGRLAKIAEEHGEVIEAFIGATGQNPRKGVTHTMGDVEKELLDLAITALGALEHLRGHDGQALPLLNAAIERVAARAINVQEVGA